MLDQIKPHHKIERTFCYFITICSLFQEKSQQFMRTLNFTVFETLPIFKTLPNTTLHIKHLCDIPDMQAILSKVADQSSSP